MLAPAEEPAEIVSVLLPLPGAAMLVGTKLAVTRLGRPPMDNATVELKAPTLVLVSVKATELPALTLALEALGVKLKLAGGATAKVMV